MESAELFRIDDDMDISLSEDIDDRTIFLHRCFRCFLKAITWYSSNLVAGLEIACLESILYSTCLLLYTLDELGARALMTRLIICIMTLFATQSPVLAIAIASYFTFYSGTFENYTETMLCKLTVIKLLSCVMNVPECLFMYAIMGLIAVGYKDFFLRGAEDIFLLVAIVVPLIQSLMEVVTRDTIFVVFLSAVYWGDRKLSRLVEEGYFISV